jgi:hypothetical protein
MSQLGFGWFPQTVGLVERNQRPLLADELAALALALETTPDVLALPPPGVSSVTFGGHGIPAQRLSVIDDSVSWDRDDIKVTAPSVTYRPGEVRAVVDAMREMLSRGAAPQQQGEETAGAEDIPVRRPGKRRGRSR